MLSIKPQNRPTIVDIINKPFIKKRIEKYMGDLLNRTGPYCQGADELYLDSLREQGVSLGIINSSGGIGEEEILRKYPSSNDLERRSKGALW